MQIRYSKSFFCLATRSHFTPVGKPAPPLPLIPLFFISGFVAQPETNFVIADFWRWMVIHMWVEAFFEVFVTVIVSYLMVLMGLVSRQAAIRVVYIATLLFLGTGLLGISHNFYWNAKPVATMALGSVFSTLQFVPLILLTVEAWRFKNMPNLALSDQNGKSKEEQSIADFAFPEVFLFLIAMNFWNFFGAGVLGIIINLPIMNYFEHGTYLTVNHAHAALMGVYGNISLGAMLFASKILKPSLFNILDATFLFISSSSHKSIFCIILSIYTKLLCYYQCFLHRYIQFHL
ncbi:MAG: cbb3-type cytochrome c oxidase subunit I [Campylobacteraceae bacterium]|nr:cbb3-type cytochrome c oxidase subunit I [Campylobacteraceae bacterium]